MPVRPPVQIAYALSGNVATLTQDVPVGWDVIVVAAWEPDEGAFLSAGTCTDTKGNTYSSVFNSSFHVSPGNIESDWDPRFLVSILPGSLGDKGYLGDCAYSTRVTHALSIGDTITIPRATHIGALKTKGLVPSGSHPLFYGLSSGAATLSDDSLPQREWSIEYPFGTTGVPALPMQPGDLLIGMGVFRFPFVGTDTPDYTVEVPPAWHLHANWTGQASGAAAPDGMILTSLRARTPGLYDFRGSIGTTAEAIYRVTVLGFRGTPGVFGGGPSSVHSQHGRYVVATEESNRIRIRRAPGPLPPFEYDVLVGPTGCNTPRLAWNPIRDRLELAYLTTDGVTERITSDDSGKTWSNPLTVFTDGTLLAHEIDEHGFGVSMVFTELNPATGVGSFQVARQGPGDAAPGLPENVISQLTGAVLFWEPQGATLSPANDNSGHWLLTATAEGDDLTSQWVSTDRCLSFKPA